MLEIGKHYRALVAGRNGDKGKLALVVQKRLTAEYPGSAPELCALIHDGPFQLLAATILSAQCTDERVNMVSPVLFARFGTPKTLSRASLIEVEEIIHSTGFYKAKAANLVNMAAQLVERFDSEVPADLDDLVTLPGVGRKTANVVRSVAFGLPGLPVDTHVLRLSRRLGIVTGDDPVKVETELCQMLPEESWGAFSLGVILHGRKVCAARRPRCDDCLLADICPSVGINNT